MKVQEWLRGSSDSFRQRSSVSCIVFVKNAGEDNQECEKSDQIGPRASFIRMSSQKRSDPIQSFDEKCHCERQKQLVVRALPEFEEEDAGCQATGCNHAEQECIYPHFYSPSQMSPISRIAIDIAAVSNRQKYKSTSG